MNTPFISFIVPVYKVEKYLPECVDSIINQSSDDWELILIDDGSPDRCPQICDEYTANDSRIKVIHQQNNGVATARNAGLDVAKGEWIWFVDSDDWIEADAVHKLKMQLNEIANSVMIDQIMFGHVRHEDHSCIIRNGIKDISGNKIEFLNSYHSFFNPCMLFRNDKIQEHKLRFTEGIRLAEDLEFQYKYEMLCQHPIAISDALYHYRIHKGSVTHKESYRRHAVEDITKVLGNLLDFIHVHKFKSEDWLGKRLEMLMKNMLYSASQVKGLDVCTFQDDVRSVIDGYREIGFMCFDGRKIRLAYYSVRLYFITNKIYLKLKGIS